MGTLLCIKTRRNGHDAVWFTDSLRQVLVQGCQDWRTKRVD